MEVYVWRNGVSFFSRGEATLQEGVSVRPYVGLSVCMSHFHFLVS